MKRETAKRMTRPAVLLAGTTLMLSGCSFSDDSYLNDTTAVQCNGTRTIADLDKGSEAAFTVHYPHQKQYAVVAIKRIGKKVMWAERSFNGDEGVNLSGLAYSSPAPIIQGPEFDISTGPASWLIDANATDNTVFIQGNCAA